MIKIHPFRGIRYSKDKVGDLSQVVTQPYDKIDDKLMEIYYERHQNNFTRIIKARVEPDTVEDNRYVRAQKFMHKWLKEGILIRDKAPAIYPYYQEYSIDGVKRVRKGVTLLVNLRETEVKAHEKTLEGPKADRLNLMWTTAAHTGHIFILYPDPEGKINAILDKKASAEAPLAVAGDDFDATHKLWAITDRADIDKVQNILAPHDLFIADGHHRTETARNYMKAMDLIGLKAVGTEIPENCMMTLISMQDPGLVVLPTHRLLHSVPGFNKDKFIEMAKPYFVVEELSSCETGMGAAKVFKLKMDESLKAGKHSISVYFKDGSAVFLTLKDEKTMLDLFTDDKSRTWKTLDVNVLHVLILEKFYGIDAEKLAMQTNVKYYRGVEEGLGKLAEHPTGNALFVMNSTRVDEVEKVALAGERMPQKSTDFFPKLIDGLVFNKIMCSGWPADQDEFYKM
jgi:uncharacterized protein (DUF1015 family)